MDDLIRVASLVAITVLSIQMGLFFNWALLSLMLESHEPCQAKCRQSDQVLFDSGELGLASPVFLSPWFSIVRI